MDPCHLNVTDSAKGALTAGPDLGWAFGGAKSEAVFGSYAKAIGTTGGTTNSYEQNSSAGILAALEPITFSGGIPTSFQLVARCSMDVDAEAWVLHDQYEGTGSMDTWAYANMTVNSVY